MLGFVMEGHLSGDQLLWVPECAVDTSSMTVGSRSTKTAQGTCFPEPVSLKKVLKEPGYNAIALIGYPN